MSKQIKTLSGTRNIRVAGKLYRLVPQVNCEYTDRDVSAAREAITKAPTQTPRVVCNLLINRA